MPTTNSNKQVFVFGKQDFSAYQPIDIKPVFGRNWITNGDLNKNFKTYQDAYDDSPTNNSIISAKASFVFGEGLFGDFGTNLSKYISHDDLNLAILDYEKFGGCSFQVIWSLAKKPLKLEYLPISKVAIYYDKQLEEVTGYYYSYDWSNRGRYPAKLIPKFTGRYVEGQNLECIYIRRATSESFFPIPSWLSGIKWAQIEGEIANAGYSHFKNGLGEITVINYNSGEAPTPTIAKEQADSTRKELTGTNSNALVVVSYNDGMENATTVDRVAPASLEQHNIFYSEEAERKLIVAHSAPPILFAGSNQGNGFSSNADEREIALKNLYRQHINPSRNTIIRGVELFFKLVGYEKLEFKDFDSETKLDTTEVVTLDQGTLDAQAQLKGSVGGVQSLLEVQASYVAGTTTYEAAIAILDLIFGFTREQAIRLLGKPKIDTTNGTTAA